jgi:hypothetical protein
VKRRVLVEASDERVLVGGAWRLIDRHRVRRHANAPSASSRA